MSEQRPPAFTRFSRHPHGTGEAKNGCTSTAQSQTFTRPPVHPPPTAHGWKDTAQSETRSPFHPAPLRGVPPALAGVAPLPPELEALIDDLVNRFMAMWDAEHGEGSA